MTVSPHGAVSECSQGLSTTTIVEREGGRTADWRDEATFICGHRKSGTTLLLSLFDAHPELCVFPPDSGFFYAYFPIHETGDYSDEEKKSRIINVMYRNLRDELENLEAWQDRDFPFDRLSSRFLERMEGEPCSARNLLREAVLAYDDIVRSSTDACPKRWMEKTTSTEIYASEVFSWYPGTRCIHLIRDPRDNYASLKSGWAARYRDQNDTVERLLQSALDRGGLGLKLARPNAERYGRDRYRVVRFEDLTAEPEPVMRELCEFLGISYDDILLKPTYYGLPWRGNNFDGLKFDRPSAANVGRWKSRIDEHEAKVIEFYCGEDMARWGYEPVFSRDEQIDAAMEHYKWFNFAQRFSVVSRADTYRTDKDDTRLIEKPPETDPRPLTVAEQDGRTPNLDETRKRRFGCSLPPEATMAQMIAGLWRVPRDLISEGYDAALEALAGQVPMTIHQYPTGMHAWTWIVPEQWTCREAYLETLDGRRLFSYQDCPLHVVSYSLPFEGEVTREELFEHLHVHPKLPDAIPYVFKFYDRDWGLCCTRNLRDSLTDERYRVVIRTDFSPDTLKVGEVIAPGATDECIVLCAHLCHPCMVNDDLSGVVVGVEVVRRLLARRDPHYTYRFLILPETIGSLAYLSQNEDLIPRMQGGLFLEMLGLDNAHALQLSFAGDTMIDQCCRLVLEEGDPKGWVGDFNTVISNDERQFNAPGVRVPMLSLSRVLPPSSPDWPFAQYHTSQDDPQRTSVRRLEESRDLVLAMIDAVENNRTPINRFKGEVFCSRYNMYVDFYTDPEGNRALLQTMHRVDGTRSIADIAESTGTRFTVVKGIVDALESHGLVTYKDRATGAVQ